MTQIKNLIILSLIIIGTSCSSIEIFKEKTEFKPYKKYGSFVILNREIGHKGFPDAYLDALVSDGLKDIFESQGMVYEREKPDLIIRYTSNEDRREKEVFNDLYPMWGYRIWDPWMYNPRMFSPQNTSSSRNYELMQLIVDFVDPGNEKMLMSVTAVSEIHNPKEKNRKVMKSVEKIGETYYYHIK
jgi:hypothetical protein